MYYVLIGQNKGLETYKANNSNHLQRMIHQENN